MKPFLKWVGGKRWLVPRLSEIYDPSKRLVEPFAGGLSIALGLQPSSALLSDINPHLINLYTQVKNGLTVHLEHINESSYYYSKRERFNELISIGDYNTSEAAELFYYLNKHAFNGVCRFNSKGKFNVPFGSYKTVSHLESFEDYTSVFHSWQFLCSDFEKLEVSPDDWVYLDPPYHQTFTNYSGNEFGEADQIRLAEWATSLPCPVVASNSNTDFIRNLYSSKGFSIEELPAPRSVGAKGSSRGSITELLIQK